MMTMIMTMTVMMMITICDDMTGIRAECCAAMRGMQTPHNAQNPILYERIVLYDYMITVMIQDDFTFNFWY